MKVTLNDVTQLVSLQLGIRNVKSSDHLLENLGAESLDVQNLMMAVEDKFNIQVGDAEMQSICTVSDIFELVSAKV